MQEQQVGISRYAEMVLTLWEQVKYYSTELKKDYNEGNRQKRPAFAANRSALAATLSEMWEELKPKIIGTNLEKEFMEYKEDATYPMLLQYKPERMFELKNVLREALEKVSLTKWERY